MLKLLLVAAGGAFGSLMRYWVSNIEYKNSNALFPLGTFLVNITGSLLIGFLWGISERFVFPSKLRAFAFIGVLGGYTTFSAFSLESFNLIKAGEYKIALGNILLTNVVGILFVFIGYYCAILLLNGILGRQP
ncbi:MAG: fluoride efflux transporter CrcB [Candidatus Margulisiibacteriota bacterium]